MRDVNANMNNFNKRTEANSTNSSYSSSSKPDTSKPPSKDYIEFEEIK